MSKDNPNDSDDLEDLDYGDDDFDLESKTGFSQNSNARISTQDVEDEEEEEDIDEDDDDGDQADDDEEERQNEASKDLRDVLLGGSRDELQANQSQHGQRRGQKRKHDHQNEDDEGQEEDEEEADCDQSRNSDKRTAERCKFWPQCLAGNECSFYHPTKPCRTFPNCRFGDSCLYIHPPCKFSPYCTKNDCPFAHTAKQQVPKPRGRGMVIGGGGIRASMPMASPFRPQAMQAAITKCKFGFKCANLMCKYSHQASEPCRYGANCLLENCAFSHPTDQQAQQENKSTNVFKWTAKK